VSFASGQTLVLKLLAVGKHDCGDERLSLFHRVDDPLPRL
jgi:hypothetical protein